MLDASPATATQAGAVERHAPDAIRDCLCLDQAVTALSAELDPASESDAAQRQALAAPESRADTARRRASLVTDQFFGRNASV